MITGIEHIALASPDPEKLAAWYAAHLGFVMIAHSPEDKTTFVRSPDGAVLEIIASSGVPRGPQQMRDVGMRHIALAVDDFDSTRASLVAAGAVFLTESTTLANGNRIIFFADPDGNYLHLIQRVQPLE
jgi:glyoxylase I family protein